MYTFQDIDVVNSAWDVLSLAAIFLVGVYIALAGYRHHRVPQGLALLMYFWHTIFCVFYLNYSLAVGSDAVHYFINSQDLSGKPELGTSAITLLTASLTQGLKLSYGGVFLVFNILGFLGMLALTSVVLELIRGSGKSVRLLALIILLLPGLSVWSAALGKDAISFLSVCLACRASTAPTRRFRGVILAVVLMLLVRPHMAALMAMSFSVAMIISGDLRRSTRLFFVLGSVPVATYLLILALNYVGLGSGFSAIDFAAFLEQRQIYGREGTLGIDIANMSVLGRILTYLFRPNFFDDAGLLGIVISIENSILLILMTAALSLWFIRRKSKLPRYAWWFLLIYALVSCILLANFTANMGIAMRQKWMFMPMIIVLCFSYIGRSATNIQRSTK